MASSVPHAAVKGYTWMLPALGQMEMEAHTAVGSVPNGKSAHGDTGQIIYMRLSGLNGGKMSGLQGQVRGALMTFTGTKVYQGRWLGKDETAKA